MWRRLTGRYKILNALSLASIALAPLLAYHLSNNILLSLCLATLLVLTSRSFCSWIGLLCVFWTVIAASGLWRAIGAPPDSALDTIVTLMTLSVFVSAAVFALRGQFRAPLHAGGLRERLYRSQGENLRAITLLIALFFFALLCLRSIPAGRTLVYAVVFLFCRHAIPDFQKKNAWTLKTMTASAVLMLFSLAAAIAILEIGTRLLIRDQQVTAAFIRPDPESIWTWQPGSSIQYTFNVSSHETRTVEHHISSQGLRDREYPQKGRDEYRILMLGDSYTMGPTTTEEFTIPRLLEGHLNGVIHEKQITVINAGVGGFGPWQEHVILRRHGFPLEPDLVIMQIFPTNDLEDSLRRIGKRFRSFNWPWHKRIEEVKPLHLWQFRFHRWLRFHSRAYQIILNVKPSYTFVRVWNEIRFLPPCRHDPLPPSEPRPWPFEVDLREWYPEIEEGLSLMMQDVAAIVRDCHERDIDVIAYIIPMFSSLLPDKFLEDMGKDAPKYERLKGCRVVHEELAGLGLSVVDIPKVLEAHPDTESLFYPLDGHFSESGHDAVAQHIAQYLIESYFPAKGLLETEKEASPAFSEAAY